MGRFDHLELGDWLPEKPDQESESGVVDQFTYLERADQAFADENYERALAYYSRVLQYDINMEEAWVGQIRCLVEMRELQEAIIWSNGAMERFPHGSLILATRSIAESRMGRKEAAIGYSDASMREQGVTPYCWIARGEVLVAISPSNAGACFGKAIELAASDWQTRAWIARAYIIHRCYHQALQHLREAVKLDPNRFPCWYWIGKCSESLGEIEEAKRAYGRALSVEPKFTVALDAMKNLENRGLVKSLRDGVRRMFGRRTPSEVR